MTKAAKITYWIATIWLALGMTSSGIVQLIKYEEGIKATLDIGYPPYFLTILGVWKILGVVAILVPKFPLVKEWAYGGFFFVASGAAFSHIASGTYNELFPSLLLLALTILSWYFRPAGRKIASVTQ
jgi:hypothetical protein